MEPGPTASKKETITPSSTIPYLKAIQISARSEPISPSYDPNEFVHFYKKKSHKKIMIFIKNRCAQVMTNLIAPFMEELRRGGWGGSCNFCNFLKGEGGSHHGKNDADVTFPCNFLT